MAKKYPTIHNFTERSIQRIVDDVYQTPTTVKTYEFTRTTASSVSPGYPDQLRENGFTTQWTESHWRHTPVDIYTGSGANRRLTRNWVTGSCPTLQTDSTLISDCDYHSLLRMYSEIPQITANLALLYAERKKTVESIALALGGIVKCIREVRKGKVPELIMNRGQLRTRKKYSGAWLNYTYGIKPFVQDLHALANSDLSQVIYISGKNKVEQLKLSPNYRVNTRYGVKHKFGLSLRDPITATLAGAGLTNPALIAWELTPFSFMADWLLPVGPYLEMLTSTQGYNKHSGSVTRYWASEGYAWSSVNSGGIHQKSWNRMTRTTSAFPDVPLPRFKNPVSPIHALNALSIIHQFVKEKK